MRVKLAIELALARRFTFGTATKVTCEGAPTLPGSVHDQLPSCYASAADTTAYVYADTLGRIVFVGREWPVPADRATRSLTALLLRSLVAMERASPVITSILQGPPTRIWATDSSSIAVILDLPPHDLDLAPTLNIVRRSGTASRTRWLLAISRGLIVRNRNDRWTIS